MELEDKPSSYDRVKRVVEEVRVIDTHEHLLSEEERVGGPVDPLTTLFQHYASSDLVSAGMPLETLEEIRNPEVSLEERWGKFEPYWEEIRNTGYARAVDIAVRDLYGVEGLSSETYLELARRMREANKPGLYRWVLKERAGIDFAILDPGSDFYDVVGIDTGLFAPVLRFEDFILPRERGDLERISKRYGRRIHSLSDLVKAFEVEFAKRVESLVAVKIGLAYRRSLHFEKTTWEEAERVFNRICSSQTFRRIDVGRLRLNLPEGPSFEEAKPLQDFMIHKLIQLAITHDLPLQIHTGLQEGNENVIEHSNPLKLTNLFMEYKEAKFDLFHGGYPYTSELAVLAKNFPNVYIDMCWFHEISPSAARQALSEWLDTVPSNKILGFGGDYRFVEGVYGHMRLARENIARVLAEKAEEGYTEREVAQLARKLLRDNPHNLFLSRRRSL